MHKRTPIFDLKGHFCSLSYVSFQFKAFWAFSKPTVTMFKLSFRQYSYQLSEFEHTHFCLLAEARHKDNYFSTMASTADYNLLIIGPRVY